MSYKYTIEVLIQEAYLVGGEILTLQSMKHNTRDIEKMAKAILFGHYTEEMDKKRLDKYKELIRAIQLLQSHEDKK